jgi:hypothetical protein
MEIICNYCKKSGHLKSQCFKLLRKNQNQAEGNQGGTRNGIAGSAADVVLTTITANDGIDSKFGLATVALHATIAIVRKVYMTTLLFRRR